MANQESSDLVYNYKLSSIGPGKATGSDVVHNPRGVDLAMKLHYLRGLYFLGSQAMEGIRGMKMKESMFYWLNEYFHTCGRFWRSESGRPYVKCNDCGVRLTEAQSDKTIAEWFEMEDWLSHLDLLIPLQIIGPEISFSPPVHLQITSFKCGGIVLGLSWAHILGDWFSASDFITRWAQVATTMKPNSPSKPLPKNTSPQNLEISKPPSKKLPKSLKRVDPVGDNWVSTTNTDMATFSFHVTPPQITNLKNKILGPFFESLCAIIWQSIAKIRQEKCEPKNVTLVKNNPNRFKWDIANSQIITTIEADFSPKEADPHSLATLLANQASDETAEIEQAVEFDQGLSDFVVYGTNLTFVDLQEASFYELELQGHKPDFVWYSAHGVGSSGVVIVLPGSNSFAKFEENGRLVTVILPVDEVSELKRELKNNDLLLENSIE